MIRGISFEIPNNYDNYLFQILGKTGVEKFVWNLVEDDIHRKDYNVHDKNDHEFLFVDDEIELDGAKLKNRIKESKYLSLFVNLQAFHHKNKVEIIETYDSFLKSDCQLILLVTDCIYVNVYVKSSVILEQIKQNAKKRNFQNIQYITHENDIHKTIQAN